MDNHKHTIMFIDDEVNILQSLRRVFRRCNYNIITCSSAEEGLDILKSRKGIHLIVSDQRMPGMSGTELFSKIKEDYPDIIRILLTGYTDVEIVKEAINKGSIHKVFFKPWDDDVLRLEVANALKQHELMITNRGLNQKIIEQNKKLMELNKNLEFRVKERTRELEVYIKALEISQAVLEELPVPVIGVDIKGIIVFMNKSASRLMSGEKIIAPGKHIEECFDDRVLPTIKRSLHEEENQICDIEITSRRYHLNLSPLSNENFKGKGVVMAFIPK